MIQVILSKSDEELQIRVNGKLMKKYYLKMPLPKQKQCDSVGGKNTKRAKLETERKIIAQVPNCNYLGYLIPHNDEDISIKIKRHNKTNGIAKGHFGKHMTTEPKLRIHNITSNFANSVNC
jgi:hypothetical protein